MTASGAADFGAEDESFSFHIQAAKIQANRRDAGPIPDERIRSRPAGHCALAGHYD